MKPTKQNINDPAMTPSVSEVRIIKITSQCVRREVQWKRDRVSKISVWFLLRFGQDLLEMIHPASATTGIQHLIFYEHDHADAHF